MKKIFSILVPTLLFISCALLFTTCQKEYSFEGGNLLAGTATFTIVGAGGNCSSVVSGDYFVGTALAVGNTVELQADVTTAGTYTVSTNIINGIRFSVSGKFDTTGIHTIILKGTGSPGTAGKFSFNVAVGLGCSFAIDVLDKPVSVASYTLAGAPNDCTTPTINGTYTAGKALTNFNNVDLKINVSKAGPYSISTDTLDGIYFAASGTFTSTGNQTIRLLGNGTPDFPRDLSFTPNAGSSHCSFALSIDNPEPVATYVLESGFGNPHPCIYTLSGVYKAKTPLNSTHKFEMSVFVQYAGNFSIATNIVDGMMFSYTGTFTTTGAQKVTLQGTGTPDAPGTYYIVPRIVGPHPLGGEACAVSITVQ